MKFLKQKKHQFILIMLAAGTILVLLISSSISSLSDLFSTPDKINNADNISFELVPKAITEQAVPRNSKEALDAKITVQQEKNRVADSREISFSAIGKKLMSSNQTNKSSKAVQTTSAADNAEILSSVFNTPTQKKRMPTRDDIYRAQTTTNEEQAVQQELDRIYKTPNTSPSSGQQENPKETDKERRARLLKHGFDNLKSDNNSSDNTSFQPTQKRSQLSCVVHGSQTIKMGGRLILRTLEEGRTIDNIIIPINTLLYGTAKLNENRIIIECNAVKIQNNIRNISYSIFGSDGLEGIALQSSPVQTRAADATSQQASNQVSRMAASNPFTATLSLIANDVNSAIKQEKRIEITLVDGQQVLLKSK